MCVQTIFSLNPLKPVTLDVAQGKRIRELIIIERKRAERVFVPLIKYQFMFTMSRILMNRRDSANTLYETQDRLSSVKGRCYVL